MGVKSALTNARIANGRRLFEEHLGTQRGARSDFAKGKFIDLIPACEVKLMARRISSGRETRIAKRGELTLVYEFCDGGINEK